LSAIIGIIVAFVFFEWPWRALVLAGFLLFDVFEVWIWLRWRKTRALTGAEGIVGAIGEAVTDLSPDGQVRVKGQIWKATSPYGVAVGERVEVVAMDGLRLEVKPAPLEAASETTPG
jgi:membrane-bound serine protease (ClpP class)